MDSASVAAPTVRQEPRQLRVGGLLPLAQPRLVDRHLAAVEAAERNVVPVLPENVVRYGNLTQPATR
jgi:hypothetical protein